MDDTHVQCVASIALCTYKEDVLAGSGGGKYPGIQLYPPPSLFITTGNTIVLPLPIFPAPDVPAVKATLFEEPIDEKKNVNFSVGTLCIHSMSTYTSIVFIAKFV